MSNTMYADAAKEMLRTRAKWETITASMTPEERTSLLREVAEELAISEEQELIVRRIWAEKIFAEFNPYHEHSGGGECGSCGAIQAARFMYPDLGA